MALTHQLLAWLGKVFGKKKLNILIYHQVVAQHDVMRPSEPAAKVFDWQMQLVAKYCTPMSLSDAIQALKSDALPANAICVTFDDGYLNNLTVAEPILRKHGVPATVYVATGYSSGSNMFNDRILDLIGDTKRSQFNLSAVGLGEQVVDSNTSRIRLAHKVIGKVKYLHFHQRNEVVDQVYADNKADEKPHRMMTPAQIQELAHKGVEIGAHTQDHPILKSLDVAEQVQQIKVSKQTLEAMLGRPIRHFAYPNGKLNDDYSDDTVGIIEDLGFETAVSTHWGISTKSSDFFQMKRFTPWDTSPIKFHLRMMLNQLRGEQ
ncbi:polysaccharide deacetylase family protein [Thalassotalea euphylliae]|uniref:Polysaccharide deacetylase n=1 Tax=Thalassotalea euphylliae TaxID=1655234 RepID=A0A3E0U2H3_9GAMM|nr:polysaccharide deacetylase family protein [Thalassotalea euphylliae]REL31128.1 polysaccharide deacetylase [Thalassotalea euphylliae]